MVRKGVEDRALVGGRVFTGERYADALLVEGGRVVSVGSSEEVRRDKGTGTDVVHLRGQLITPGLIDAHMHLGRPRSCGRASISAGWEPSLNFENGLRSGWNGIHTALS